MQTAFMMLAEQIPGLIYILLVPKILFRPKGGFTLRFNRLRRFG